MAREFPDFGVKRARASRPLPTPRVAPERPEQFDLIRAAPAPVARLFDFSDWQASHPNEPLPGSSVDDEFDHSNGKTNEIIERLALIQRDDGDLKNGLVTYDSLSPELALYIDENTDAAAASAAAAAASADAAATSETAAAASAAEAAADAAAIEAVFIPTDIANARRVVQVNDAGDAYQFGDALMRQSGVWEGFGYRLANINTPVDPFDAATKQFVEDTLAASGNVPAPEAEDVGDVLMATGVDLFSWQPVRLVPPSSDVGKLLRVTGADLYDWTDGREVPAGGTLGDVLRNIGGDNYQWGGTLEVPAPANPGDDAKVLTASAGAYAWAVIPPVTLAGLGGQPLDATLTALAGINPAAADAGKPLYATGADTFAFSEAVLGGWENRFINGDFRFHQYVASTGLTGGAQYVADRWTISLSGAFVATVTRAAAHPISGANGTCLQVQFTTPDASLAAGDVVWLGQRIEGYHCRDIFDGGASQMATLVFWVYATVAGIYSAFVRNGVDRTICKQFTINAANTWERKSLTFPMGTWSGGTWNRTNGIGLEIGFTLAAGSTYVGTLDAWGAATVLAGAGQANAGNATNNVFRLADVMFVPGSIVPARFMHRHHAQEFLLCQRYQQKSFSPDTAPVAGVGAGTGEFVWQQVGGAGFSSYEKIMFSPRMRTAPSILLRNPLNSNNESRNYSVAADNSATGASGIADSGFFMLTTNVAGSAAAHLNAVHWWAGAEL